MGWQDLNNVKFEVPNVMKIHVFWAASLHTVKGGY
jgi:hypothetical protein